MSLRSIMTLITMGVLAYGILQVKTYLNTNFIENETPAKHALNKFLNGQVRD